MLCEALVYHGDSFLLLSRQKSARKCSAPWSLAFTDLLVDANAVRSGAQRPQAGLSVWRPVTDDPATRHRRIMVTKKKGSPVMWRPLQPASPVANMKSSPIAGSRPLPSATASSPSSSQGSFVGSGDWGQSRLPGLYSLIDMVSGVTTIGYRVSKAVL